MKILILGGYGVFGGRLAELIADIAGLEVLIAGRSIRKARRFCQRLHGVAYFTPVAIARADIARALADHHPDILVDASGPFQNYGNDPWSVVAACISAGVNYLDFADGADFVAGVSRYDDAAKSAGLFVLSGVSSFPVLTAAVLAHFSTDMKVTALSGGIAPSPFAGVGMNVMRAVTGYAGKRVPLLRGGQMETAIALGESRYYTVAPPGKLPLRHLRFSLVDVPELQVLAPENPDLRDIWIGAAPVPEILHRLLNLLAKSRAALRLPSLAPLAPLFYRVLNMMRFGEHRGGMFIAARGTLRAGANQGHPVTRSWHLLAEGDDGPYIPSMAIEALIRKTLCGEAPEPGARAAIGALSLADYDTLFENRRITTGFREEFAQPVPLYQEILGSEFESLPAPVRALHDSREKTMWSGHATVTTARNPLARILARLLGFPAHPGETPVRVTFTPEAGGERWERDFGGHKFCSYQSAGKGRNHRLLVERFGVIRVAMALVLNDGRLRLVPRRWSIMGLPLPRFLLPSGESFEHAADGIFRFDVTVRAPVVGLIVAYRGALEPAKNR